jgi:hypothetical protein
MFVSNQTAEPKIVPVHKDSELYNYVIKKIADNETALLKDKIEDLEKVIYNMSTKLHILTDTIKKNSEYIVQLATVYEEVQNELEKEYGLSPAPQTKSTYSEKIETDTGGIKKQTKKTDLN